MWVWVWVWAYMCVGKCIRACGRVRVYEGVGVGVGG